MAPLPGGPWRRAALARIVARVVHTDWNAEGWLLRLVLLGVAWFSFTVSASPGVLLYAQIYVSVYASSSTIRPHL